MRLLRDRRLVACLLIGLVVRVVFAHQGTYWRDLNSFIGWSHRLYQQGFKSFYEAWSDYLPGYLYVLWFLGWLKQRFLFFLPDEILFKLPAILADLATAGVIYKLVKEWFTSKIASVVCLLYLLNPAVLANSTLWGQVDSINTLFYLLAILAAVQTKCLFTAVWTALAVVTKPQGLVILPLIVYPYLKQKQWLKLSSVGLVFSFLSLGLFWPFLPQNENLLLFAWQRWQFALNQYQATSLNAFNLWGILGMLWQPDSRMLGFVTCRNLGLGLFGLSYLVMFLKVGRSLETKVSVEKTLISLAGLLFLALFLYPTRVHERHLFSAFPFLILTASFLEGFESIYLFFSASYLANLSYAYVWLTQDFRHLFPDYLISFFSLANLGFFFLALFLANRGRAFLFKNIWLIKAVRDRSSPALETFSPRRDKLPTWIAIVVVLFALMTRVTRLGHPPEFYFDEVYHAFTAREMMRGHNAAWEWWNTPPEGFAYEWTHPPLAKEMMAVSMVVFGEKSWAWRLPGAVLGGLISLLIFLLSKQLFASSMIALMASLLYSWDFLPLVQSRIGMNDIYFLFFQLLSFLIWLKLANSLRETPLLAKKRHLLYLVTACLAWGLALASKWSALYGLFFILWLLLSILLYQSRRSHKKVFGEIVIIVAALVVIPTLVYLLTYLPFFTSGHSLSQFWELQKQMWWYHTRLRATHPYTSPWWSWPLDLQPVWYFVKYETTKVANIYAFGNPFIWWLGLFAQLWLLWLLVRLVLSKGLEAAFYPPILQPVLVVLGYFSFFLPWAFSPRIMFIYHYLPSLPFAYLSLALLILNIWQRWEKGRYLVLGYLILVGLIFTVFYPYLTATFLPKGLARLYLWFPGWR